MPHKKFGFFFELSADKRRDTINELRCDIPHENEAEIINYLLNGFMAGVVMLIDHDGLKEPPELPGPATLRSDNEWIWPESLAYFVREYHLELPPDFIAKMKKQGWRIPPGEKYIPDIPEGHVVM